MNKTATYKKVTVGFIIAGLIFITKLCSLEMQGVSYLSPISPFDIKSQNYAIIRKSNNKIKCS